MILTQQLSDLVGQTVWIYHGNSATLYFRIADVAGHKIKVSP